MLTTDQILSSIDQDPHSVYVMHEKFERRFPVHRHQKGQLTYIEGGIAYISANDKTYVIPARHYVWIPHGLNHVLNLKNSLTAIRSLYFYTNEEDNHNPFYQQMGIYPMTDLLVQMIGFTEKWNGIVHPNSDNYKFLVAIKTILPQISTKALPIALPTTHDERLRPILIYMHEKVAEPITLASVATTFGLGERTLSRLFQSAISISFLQYLKLLRIVKGIEMILQTKKTISEIAYATGYNSISSFSKAFYQITNIRPSDFSKY